jgi:putative transposase
MSCAAVALVVGTNGTWTRWSSRLEARSSIFGEQWTRTATCSTSSCRADATKRPPRDSFGNCSKGGSHVPRVIIPDKLKSYGAAKREILPAVEHRQHKRLNNRAENSHQPTRLREKKMRRFKSAKQAQRFLSAFGPIAGHFQPRRHRLSAGEYRASLQGRFQTWNEVTGVKQVA